MLTYTCFQYAFIYRSVLLHVFTFLLIHLYIYVFAYFIHISICFYVFSYFLTLFVYFRYSYHHYLIFTTFAYFLHFVVSCPMDFSCSFSKSLHFSESGGVVVVRFRRLFVRSIYTLTSSFFFRNILIEIKNRHVLEFIENSIDS